MAAASANISAAVAPAPDANARQATASDILGTCKEGDFTCYKNQVTDNQIVTA